MLVESQRLRGGHGSAARSGSRPLFGEDVVNLLHDPFCPLNRSGDHGGGSRTLPGVEEIIGGSQVTSYEDSRDDRQDSFSAFILPLNDGLVGEFAFLTP